MTKMRVFVFLLPVLALFASNSSNAQSIGIQWITIEEAMDAQAQEPRKIIMDVYTQWCGPCKMMMANTFTHPDVIDFINDNYYAVKFDAEGPDPVTFQGELYENEGYREGVRGRNSPHPFSRALGVSAYPTLIFMSEKGQIIAPITGYKTPFQLEPFLTFFSEHWSPTTGQAEWDAFKTTFESTFD